jgi:hypothetical protein
MLRFSVMSRLGLAEPLVRLARAVEKSNRVAAESAGHPLNFRLRFERTV